MKQKFILFSPWLLKSPVREPEALPAYSWISPLLLRRTCRPQAQAESTNSYSSRLGTLIIRIGYWGVSYSVVRVWGLGFSIGALMIRIGFWGRI